nr:putative reverse transcriptase domain-containing protein [Tanacetum cinerariifolium]
PSAQSANVITMARVLRSATSATRDGKETPKGNGCFECGASGHFKRDYPKLKNKHGGNRNAQGWVYAVGNVEKNGNAPMNPDSNVVTGTFLLNNLYASILFDTGADRSFISIAFSSLVNIDPTPIGSNYDVELADGKIVGIDTIIRGCIINFQNHLFNIDLMPVELGSFDVIIGMDWLRRCHAVIVCDEKLVQIPYGNKTLTFCGNESNNGRESRLAVISCIKAQEYMAKGYLGDILSFEGLLLMPVVVSGRIISLSFVVNPFRIGAKFLVHQVVCQLDSFIQRLGLGRLYIPINVIRESTDVLINLLVFISNELGTYQGQFLETGNEGVVGLTRWIEKMKSVFNISGCAIEN